MRKILATPLSRALYSTKELPGRFVYLQLHYLYNIHVFLQPEDASIYGASVHRAT
jgi:hypothetical protein